MKVAAVLWQDRRWVVRVDEDAGMAFPFDMPESQAQSGVICLLHEPSLPKTLPGVSLRDVKLLAPIPLPGRNIFCVGKNYHEHAREFSNSGFDSSAAAGVVPKHPIIFSKVPDSVIATNSDVLIDPHVSTSIDYEAELAVIIGKPGRGVSRESAFDHVWGYTIINDVTARDMQGRYSQWLIGKSQDTFCPMGPWAVTKDSFDLEAASVRCFVNGEIRQNAKVSQLIFDIPTIIATLSEGITLKPGDIIATGTPAGVGIGFDPPRYLREGDKVRVEIDGIGALENRFMHIS
ncbi:fumarylacetoacetate hydrolase family protein [Mesorhizobium sp. VK24D]|uniref:Fumarylacetoacetate hydrolase family protein n=1 Tax=Mesorhizobium album TaxID=3072314 RepID=A0ABU4Y4I8_9HYPH|nr:fumarylacetoacetate hydrolase family protein [Mesorhizobium sp. VK24D]MDX8481856.1 fumarylacetoacetate hydrolase family protein [Mesorhizobium sp. VK24D]